jgi:hypothetical protein
MLPELDGGSQGNGPSPDGSGGSPQQGGTQQGGGAPSAEQIKAAAEALGLEVVPQKEYAELERNYKSVKFGKISKILSEHDKLEKDRIQREEGDLSDHEKAKKAVERLTRENDDLKGELGRQALMIGVWKENLKRALPNSKEDAVFPEFVDMQMDQILDEFQGGDAEAFVQSALNTMGAGMKEILGRLAPPPGPTPGGGPGGHARHGQPELPDGRSPIAKAYDWADTAVTIHNPVHRDGKIRR